MAQLLFRLGRFSARRAWIVLSGWIVLLSLMIGAALSFGGSFSSNLTLSGTPAQQVIDDLKKNFPDASRGSAQMVFQTVDGKPFTDEQKALIGERLDEMTSLAGVSGVVNPFATQADRDAQTQELSDANTKVADAPAEFARAQAEIDNGWTELNSGLATIAAQQAQLNSGRTQLEASQQTVTENRAQVDAAIAQMEAAALPETEIAPLRAQQQQLIAAQAELDAKRAELNAGAAQLSAARQAAESGRGELVAGQAELDSARAELPGQIERLSWANALMDASAAYGTVSADGSTAIATVLFDKPLAEVSSSTQTAVTELLGTPGPDGSLGAGLSGVTVEYSKELVESLDGLLGIGEVIGLVIAAIVLVVMLGSLIAAGLPLITALIGVAISMLGALALASVIEMNSTTPTLGVMLGLAVGIDYSLFILHRHRTQLKNGMDVRQSVALANGTAGSAVFFAGLTVMIALLALNLTGVGFLGVMGSVAAISILISVLAAITFTPAIAALLGYRVLSRRERRRLAEGAPAKAAVTPASAADQPANTVSAPTNAAPEREVWAAKRPVWASVIAVGLLAVIAIPLGVMRLGLPDGSSEPVDSTQYRAYTVTSEAFGAGANGLITSVVTLPDPVTGDDQLRIQSEIATQLMTVDNVAAVVPAAVSEDEQRLIFAVQPAEGPASASTEQVVRDLRALEPELAQAYDASLGVTGMAAVNIDISKKLSDALPLYLGVVLGLSLILLILVFRSLLLPLVATAGFLLTVLASLGAVVAVYQLGWLGAIFDVHDPGPILSFLPTLLIGILFGLAMDYQLFIATGIREAYAHGDSPRAAITRGVRAGRSVVIAAAIIMISVFGSFAFGHLAVIKPIGFGLAVGILFDAFFVRLMLVPALLRLFGRGAWWLPKWLDRVLPDMDVEGAKLERPTGDPLVSTTTGANHVVRPRVKSATAPHRTPTPTE